MEIKEVPVESLIPYEWNNKIHDENQINMIANSIKEFWFKNPILIDKNNVVIAGHWRLESAKKLWMEKVPVIIADDLTEEQIKKYRILDNKLNESPRDIENLKMEFETLPDISFWDLKVEVEDLFWDEITLDPEKLWDWFSLPDWDKAPFQQMTFTVADEQKAEIEEAIKLVKQTDLYKSQMNYWNENLNWNALYCIISQWMTLNK